MNIAHIIKSLIPDFEFFAESEVQWEDQNVGFQSTIVTRDNSAFAGGFGVNLNTARRICAAEGIERAIYYRALRDDRSAKALWLDKYPTTCGFAAGFEPNGTIFRAECEALERWAWEKWIDDGCVVPQKNNFAIPKSHAFFASVFDKVFVFEKEFGPIGSTKISSGNLVFTAVIGLKGNGVFPGSRVSEKSDRRLEHALVEAWRHSRIFQELENKKPSDIIEERISYFGSRGSKYLGSLNLAKNEWAEPLLVLSSGVVESADYFVHRAICDGLIGWDRGDETRFVY